MHLILILKMIAFLQQLQQPLQLQLQPPPVPVTLWKMDLISVIALVKPWMMVLIIVHALVTLLEMGLIIVIALVTQLVSNFWQQFQKSVFFSNEITNFPYPFINLW